MNSLCVSALYALAGDLLVPVALIVLAVLFVGILRRNGQ